MTDTNQNGILILPTLVALSYSDMRTYVFFLNCPKLATIKAVCTKIQQQQQKNAFDYFDISDGKYRATIFAILNI